MSTSSVPRSASRTSNPPFTSPSPVPSPVSNLEPDEAWKEQKMREIEDGFQGMIKDAKDRLEASILALTAEKNSPEWEARKERLVEEFKVEKKFIQGLAHEEFMNSVATERFTRGMTITGLSVNATVKQSLLEEQEAILAQIQKDKARRDSTAGPAPEPNISSRSDSPVVSREAPQRAHDSQSSQHETRRPRTVSTSTSSTTNLSVPESVPVRSSPERQPPANSYHPDPPPPEIRPSSVPQPVVPPVSTNEPAFGSLRRKSSSIAQERRTPRPGTSPVPSSPIDNRRMSTGPTPPTSGSSHRAPTSSSISPAPLGARHDPSRQPTTSPVQERTTHFPGPSTSHPPSARSEPTTSQTWKEATSTPIHVEPYRQGPSSLNSKRSQSNFRNMSEATSAPIPTTPSRPGSSSLNAKRSHSNLQSMSAGTRADDSWMEPS
ncbi:hypothetical protein K438DRAFT_931395 [Mycena galopus ATCC 62051]|nr:hypothetical protein K438DRAFT_931395 [Mycena galopus ATCC 62051]